MPPGSSNPGQPYLGRFAPSPTGDLHFGSLVAAVGSFLQARRHGGAWRVRVEDIDPPREVKGSAKRILSELRRLGMEPDGAVLYQSDRLDAYAESIDSLIRAGLAFHCGCSRADYEGAIYPGTCRNGLPAGRKARAVRLRVDTVECTFEDAVQGTVSQDLGRDCGDFVIRRADGWPAYQLAVVVDDAHQGVTEVVRGADLLDSTPRQHYLQRQLGLPHPAYLHLPLALDHHGHKLSKRTGSDPLSAQPPVESLYRALEFLGQAPPRVPSLDALWDWALVHWDPARIPAGKPPVLTGPPT